MLSKKSRTSSSLGSSSDEKEKKRWWVNDLWPVQQQQKDNFCLHSRKGMCYDSLISFKNECRGKLDNLQYPEDIKNMVSETAAVKINKPFDIVSLLSFNGTNNYLARNDGDVVRLDYDTFRGKYVMVLCFLIPLHRLHDETAIFQSLANLCFEMCETGACSDNVEIVLVPNLHTGADHDYANLFDEFLSAFPRSCLFVPFRDSDRRDYICCYLDVSHWCRCFIVDPNSVALLRVYPNFAINSGADSFPFTTQVIDAQDDNDSLVWKTASTTQLDKLLGCAASDLLYKVNQDDWAEEDKEKVSISQLNQKVVGLFYWSEGTCCIKDDSFVYTLRDAYDQCRAKQQEFEIVVVYIPFTYCLPPDDYILKVDKFLKDNNISWWKMPFNNSKCLRLFRICSYGANKLIIVGPRNEYVDCRGRMILSKLGPDAYPFTRAGLVLNHAKLLRDLTFESLLVSQSCNYVYKNGTHKPLSDIQPCNVMLYLGRFDDISFAQDLHKWCEEIKSNHSDFDVIFVRRTSDQDNTKEYEDYFKLLSSCLPWMERPYEPDHSLSLQEKLFPHLFPFDFDTLVLFGSDGHVCSVDVQNLFYLKGPRGFPFDCDLRKDASTRLTDFFSFMRDDFYLD